MRGLQKMVDGDRNCIDVLTQVQQRHAVQRRLDGTHLLGTSYLAMALAGFLIGWLFQVLGLVPAHHFITAFQTPPSWNYTTLLDLAALALAVVLGWRFLTTGGMAMLRAMERAPSPEHAMVHDHHEHHHHH